MKKAELMQSAFAAQKAGNTEEANRLAAEYCARYIDKKPRATVQEMNYKNLLPLISKMGSHDHLKINNDPYMPLVIERIGEDVYTMSHYGEQNGDLMADPDMEILLIPETESAEALTFRNDYMGLYQEVRREIDGKRYISPKLRSELNRFLSQWLKNLKQQGFYA